VVWITEKSDSCVVFLGHSLPSLVMDLRRRIWAPIRSRAAMTIHHTGVRIAGYLFFHQQLQCYPDVLGPGIAQARDLRTVEEIMRQNQVAPHRVTITPSELGTPRFHFDAFSHASTLSAIRAHEDQEGMAILGDQALFDQPAGSATKLFQVRVERV
jgi:hypothetical protein